MTLGPLPLFTPAGLGGRVQVGGWVNDLSHDLNAGEGGEGGVGGMDEETVGALLGGGGGDNRAGVMGVQGNEEKWGDDLLEGQLGLLEKTLEGASKEVS